MRYLSNLDLTQNQLLNARLHPVGTAPASPQEGQIYFNSTAGNKKMYYYDNAAWIPLTASSVYTAGTGMSLVGGAFNNTAPDQTVVLTGSGATVITGTYPNFTISSTDTNTTADGSETKITAGTNVSITGTGTTVNPYVVNSSFTNTTYTAGAGLTLTGTVFSNSNVITASNFGDAGITRTLAFGGTFIVPYVTYNAQGELLTKSNLTLTLPANVDTNTFHNAFAWTGGTTAGPTGALTGTAATVSYAAFPSASGLASGIVTTGAQSFAGDKTFDNNVVVTGNLTVNGTVTTVNTETINLADNIITLNSNYTGAAPTENGGIEVERGTLANASLIWNETTDKWQTSVDSVTFFDIVTSAQSFSATIGNGTLTTIPVTHNLGTRDIIVQLFDLSSYDTIYADIVRSDGNTINVSFGIAPTLNDIRVLITKIGASIT